MVNLINDLSVLTDVPDGTLKKFQPLTNYCISHAVYESQLEKSDVTEVDIGIGKIMIQVAGNSIKYKFVPSKELERMITQTVVTNSSPIVSKLDSKLQHKIERAYKELL